ncbi:MAG: hypothetical protein PHU51_05685 [Candidatus Nanoarchaeia archaeon]|nr:hypothetical protein [Candidatus Nanoarchaeia archaeon]
MPEETLPSDEGTTEVRNAEQPVDLEDLFHELETLVWSLADECREIDEVITLMQARRAAKEEEYGPRMQEVEENIKAEILKRQAAFKCDWGAATYRKAYDRTSWDSKKLDGLALLLPQIQECKTITKVDASVSLKVGCKV